MARPNLVPASSLPIHGADFEGDWRYRLRARLHRGFGPPPATASCEVIHSDGRYRLDYRRDSTDRDVIRQVFRHREYDLTRLRRRADLEALLAEEQAAGRRPLVIDAGANIGASAAFFALAIPDARVIAVEPEAANFELLGRNTRGLDVRCLQAALGSARGYVHLHDTGEGAWAFRTEPAPDETGIPCRTVPDLLAEFGGPEWFPFLVKLDIEGAEQDVFRGETGWVRQVPVLAIELHDWMLPASGSARPFLECIASLDRDFVQLGENILSLDNGRIGKAQTYSAHP